MMLGWLWQYWLAQTYKTLCGAIITSSWFSLWCMCILLICLTDFGISVVTKFDWSAYNFRQTLRATWICSERLSMIGAAVGAFQFMPLGSLWRALPILLWKVPNKYRDYCHRRTPSSIDWLHRHAETSKYTEVQWQLSYALPLPAYLWEQGCHYPGEMHVKCSGHVTLCGQSMMPDRILKLFYKSLLAMSERCSPVSQV